MLRLVAVQAETLWDEALPAAATFAASRITAANYARDSRQECSFPRNRMSTSVAALLGELRRGPEWGFSPSSVLVVDEAGMLGTRDLAELLTHAATARAKVVLVGDHHQLPEIDAGGAFRALVARTDPVRLTVNRRQHEPHAREMLDLWRQSRVHEA
ncbi:MAG: AAA family ATPase, partial [Candidatus Limnocylindrales bacterium]